MTQGNLIDRLSRLLFSYRTTPQSTTGVPPAELLLGRNPQTRFHKLYPNRKQMIEEQQRRQKQQHDKQAKSRAFHIGDQVYVRNFRADGRRWVSGEIKEKTGPLSFVVLVEGMQLWRRHVDQIRRQYNVTCCGETAEPDLEPDLPELNQPSIRPEEECGSQPSSPEEVEEKVDESPTRVQQGSLRLTQNPLRRYPTRL